MINEIVMISPKSGDWESLYLNGKLIAEGHSLNARDIFDAIADVFPNTYRYKEISDERAEEGLPEYLDELHDSISLD